MSITADSTPKQDKDEEGDSKEYVDEGVDSGT